MSSPHSQPYDIVGKILVLGDSGVGKTAIMIKYVDDAFQATHKATLGVELKFKVIKCDGKKIRMMIWDTAGQEKFRSLTKSYYNKSQAIMLVFSLCDRTSFEHIEDWIAEIEENAS
mmetsp:Transcript_37926/g.33953  ORF Transcript_37926/g.33953 Transcript_37926/m.33953 type:complete len:116 (-) Transcript_37926:496-843(-)